MGAREPAPDADAPLSKHRRPCSYTQPTEIPPPAVSDTGRQEMGREEAAVSSENQCRGVRA